MRPSKESLENYFKNNRKYFDSLADNLKDTDPEYYNKSIAPFYKKQHTTNNSPEDDEENRGVKITRNYSSVKIFVFIFIGALILYTQTNTFEPTDNKPYIDENKIGKEINLDPCRK